MNGPVRIVELAVSVLIIVSIIIGATIWITENIATFGVQLKNHEKEINRLTEFAEKGDRFTSKEGEILVKRIEKLEEQVVSAPPIWFQNLFNNFKVEIKEQVNSLENEVINLRLEVELINNRVLPD